MTNDYKPGDLLIWAPRFPLRRRPLLVEYLRPFVSTRADEPPACVVRRQNGESAIAHLENLRPATKPEAAQAMLAGDA